MVSITVDYFDTTLAASFTCSYLHPAGTTVSAAGQCFQVGSVNRTLLSCKFNMKRVGSPSGNCHAALYSIKAGTSCGTASKPPDGDNPLAISDVVDVTTISNEVYVWVTFTFSGANQYNMLANTNYIIMYVNPSSGTINSSNYLFVGSAYTDDGNASDYWNAGWIAQSSDVLFYVYSYQVDNYSKTLSNKIGCLDIISTAYVSKFKTFIDILDIKDSVFKFVARLRSFADILGAKGVFNKNIGGAFFKTLTDSIGAIDSFVKQKSQHFTKIFSDIVSILDTKTNLRNILRTFLDKISTKDSKFVSYVSGVFRWVWKEHPRLRIRREEE